MNLTNYIDLLLNCVEHDKIIKNFEGVVSMALKKVYYFTVELVQIHNSEENHSYELSSILKNIIDNEAVTQKRFKSIDLSFRDDQMHIMMDVYEYERTHLFARLSKQRPSNTLIERDYNTLEKSDVLPGKDVKEKGIEMYTYIYLDYASRILSIVYAKGHQKKMF